MTAMERTIVPRAGRESAEAITDNTGSDERV